MVRLAKDEWPYLVCAALALITIWGHPFPIGVDIPQHANLFRITREMTVGPIEYRGLYRIDPFTPYLLAYAIAYPFTLLFGASAAVKCLLSLAALTTPLAMRLWLRVVGGRAELGLFGFLVAFDIPYFWGFISHELAMPLALVYLAMFERQGNRPGWRAVLKTLACGVALFFCHGITFGVSTLIVGARLVLRRRPLAAWRAGLHAVPLGLVAAVWWRLNGGHTGQSLGDDWVDLDRLVRLLSAPFTTTPDRRWAVVSLIGVVLLLLAAWPRIVLRGRRFVPLAVSTALFLALPDTVADTWLVGSRFCVFVHAFAPAVVHPSLPAKIGWPARPWRGVTLAWVAFVLVAFNVRLVPFDRETAGLRELEKHMQPGFDVRSMLHETQPHSDAMGFMQLYHATGWITADHGGILDNDSPDYYQMPIRRGPTPLPTTFRYTVARGDPDQAARMITERWGAARLVHRESSWLLFEEPPIATEAFTVVRFRQTWGQLHQDKAVSERPLAIAGVRFEHGLGTHAESFVRIRLREAVGTFAGACGIDDRAGPSGRATFLIRDDAGEVLFQSQDARAGQPARRFAIALAGRHELILEVQKIETIDHAHADWVDLTLTRP